MGNRIFTVLKHHPKGDLLMMEGPSGWAPATVRRADGGFRP